MSTVGKRIHDRREALGLSVDELAMRLGKNRATVYRYESDDIENLPTSIMLPLADILQTTPAYLMGWEEKKSTPDTGDGRESEAMELFESLPEEKKADAIKYLRFLAADKDSL